jgi:hypothetical protein
VLLQVAAQEVNWVCGALAVELHHALHQHWHHCRAQAEQARARAWGGNRGRVSRGSRHRAMVALVGAT